MYKRRSPCRDPEHMAEPCICDYCQEWVELNDMIALGDEKDAPMLCPEKER